MMEQVRRMQIAFHVILLVLGVAMITVGFCCIKAEEKRLTAETELEGCRERLRGRAEGRQQQEEAREERTVEAARLRLLTHCERYCFRSARLLGWVEVTADVPIDDPAYGRLSCLCRSPEVP